MYTHVVPADHKFLDWRVEDRLHHSPSTEQLNSTGYQCVGDHAEPHRILADELPQDSAPDQPAELQAESRCSGWATMFPAVMRALETQRLSEMAASIVDTWPRCKTKMDDVLEDEATSIEPLVRFAIPGESSSRGRVSVIWLGNSWSWLT